MHYGVLVMETKLVKLGKVAKYIKNRVDIDCSNSGEYVSTENLQSNKFGVSFPSSSYPRIWESRNISNRGYFDFEYSSLFQKDMAG